jgi:chromosome segregation ATPase
MEAQEMIRRLEEQLKQLQAAKEELEARQNELQAMMTRLEETKNMEAVERLKLEEEIHAKQAEVQRIQDEVEAKDAETRRLQQEVEDARVKQASVMQDSAGLQHWMFLSQKVAKENVLFQNHVLRNASLQSNYARLIFVLFYQSFTKPLKNNLVEKKALTQNDQGH